MESFLRFSDSPPRPASALPKSIRPTSPFPLASSATPRSFSVARTHSLSQHSNLLVMHRTFHLPMRLVFDRFASFIVPPFPHSLSRKLFLSSFTASTATLRRTRTTSSSSFSSYKACSFASPFVSKAYQRCLPSKFASFPKPHGLHTWYPAKASNPSEPMNEKLSTTVVLLGWLGARERHLKKYAALYSSRGLQVVTFVVPLMDLLNVRALNKAETHAILLAEDLLDWLKEDAEGGNVKQLIFHMFSNTGWLMYGVVLERFIHGGDAFLGKVKGCVIDSAPCEKPDARVWASGFAAAILKKGSVASQFHSGIIDGQHRNEGQVSLKEVFLIAVLEEFFSIFLRLPGVRARLQRLAFLLSHQQPTSCQQLYIFSTADSVIPVRSIESFIEEQRKAGFRVTACNFQVSPHVDHFRTFPEEYNEHLGKFLKECLS